MLSLSLVCSLSGATFAEESVKDCHAYATSDTMRLAYYDNQTGFAVKTEDQTSTEEVVEATPPSKPTKWSVRSTTSALDDTTNVALFLSSKDTIRGRFGDAGHMWVYI